VNFVPVTMGFGLPRDRGLIPGRGLAYVSRAALRPTKPPSYTLGTGGLFPGGKARPGRDADLSPSSSAEVKNE
jgi:hypothetical protein